MTYPFLKWAGSKRSFNTINGLSGEEFEIDRCALFVYLNRHGYNGLCRYSAKSGYNVPFGRYAQVYFPKSEMQAFHRKANERDVQFATCGYRDTFGELCVGDVVYCDPPYIDGFTGYTAGGFGISDHVRLADLAQSVSRHGITVAISNLANHEINKLYKQNGARLSFSSVARTINSNTAKRKPVREVLAMWEAVEQKQERAA